MLPLAIILIPALALLSACSAPLASAPTPVGLVNTTQQPVGGRDPEASLGYLALSDEDLSRMAVFYHAERRGWNK
jgi:hypothetical protein